jgi:hypothetical protein
MKLQWAVLSLLLAPTGCTVSAISAGDDPRPSNTCKSDSDCSKSRCNEGLCEALNGQLEALLVSATPPSDSSIPHLTFVTQLEDVSTHGEPTTIALPGPSRVTGSLILPKGEVCYPGFASDDPKHPILPAVDGKTLPVTVTLALRQRLLGLPQQLYYASTPSRLNDLGGYTFDLQVPGGDYDVYLVPPKNQLGGCPVPPQLYRDFPIDQQNAEIVFPLSTISTLTLSIKWPRSSSSLTGWTLDIIEPLGGNPISNEIVLDNPVDADGDTVDYPAQLSYSTVVTPPASSTVDSASDLLRLRPPAGVVAPSIFMDRSALGLLLDRNDLVQLTRFTRFPSAVQVEGHLSRVDDGTPVSGFVTLVSTEIFGVDQGIFASYQATVQVEKDGALHAKLPPGRYRVQAVPPVYGETSVVQTALAALETTWEIPVDPPVQFGKLLELQVSPKVVGRSKFFGAQVQAVPSPQIVLPFEEAFGFGQLVPRASNGLVDESGQFTLQTDPGKFDISVQAPEALGFGWFVRPGVLVADRNEDLGSVDLPAPSLLYGTAEVSLGGGPAPLGSAAIRAYAYLDKDLAYTRDPKQAVSVVQVAETRADEKGAFRLLLPSSIAAPK